jgi:hypothetical protein
MKNLVRPTRSIAGNAKKMLNWPTLPRNFSATAGDKNSRLVPKLVLRHALSGNIHLGGIGNGRENFVSIIFILSLLERTNKNSSLLFYSRHVNDPFVKKCDE